MNILNAALISAFKHADLAVLSSIVNSHILEHRLQSNQSLFAIKSATDEKLLILAF